MSKYYDFTVFCANLLKIKDFYYSTKIMTLKENIVKKDSSVVASIIFITIVAILAYFVLIKIEGYIKKEAGDTFATILNVSEQSLTEWKRTEINNTFIISQSKEFKNLTDKLIKVNPTKDELNKDNTTLALRNHLTPFINMNSDLGFFIINPSYINIGSMRDENTGDINLLKGKGFLESLFTEGKPFLTPPFISDVPLPGVTGELSVNEPTMFVGVPLFDDNGLVMAALTFRLVPSKGFTKIAQTAHLGETGETYAFNKNGYLITESRYSDKLRANGVIGVNDSTILNLAVKAPKGDLTEGFIMKKPYSDMELTTMAKKALNGEDGNDLDGYINYLGKEVVGAWTWSDELGFAIATEEETSEIYSSIRLINQLILFLIAVTVILALFMILRLKKSFSLSSTLGFYVERLSAVVEQSPAALFVTDTHGVIEYANPAFLKQMGFDEDEINGHNIRDFKAESQGQDFYENLLKTLNNGSTWIGDITTVRKDSHPINMHLRVSPLRNDKGEITQFVAVTMEDLSNIKCMDLPGALSGSWQWDFNSDVFILSPEGMEILGINHWEPELGLNEFLSHMGLEHFEEFTNEIKALLYREKDKFEYKHNFIRPDGVKFLACEIVEAQIENNVVTKINGTIHSAPPKSE